MIFISFIGQGLILYNIQMFFKEKRDFIELVIWNVYEVLSRTIYFDWHLLQIEVPLSPFLIFDFFLMTNMSLVDQFICSRSYVVMILQHPLDCIDLIVELFIIVFFEFFHFMLQAQGVKVIKMLLLVLKGGSGILDFRNGFDN